MEAGTGLFHDQDGRKTQAASFAGAEDRGIIAGI
jgi:hypothetical protein